MKWLIFVTNKPCITHKKNPNFRTSTCLQERTASKSSNSLLERIKRIMIEKLKESRTHGLGLLHPLIPQDIQLDGLLLHIGDVHVLRRDTTLQIAANVLLVVGNHAVNQLGGRDALRALSGVEAAHVLDISVDITASSRGIGDIIMANEVNSVLIQELLRHHPRSIGNDLVHPLAVTQTLVSTIRDSCSPLPTAPCQSLQSFPSSCE